MKKIFCMLLSACFYFAAAAQKVDSTAVNIKSKIAAAKSKSGKQIILSNKDIRLFAEIKSGKVIAYSATNSKGESLKISYFLAEFCKICIEPLGEDPFCYMIDCKDMPKPKEFKTRMK